MARRSCTLATAVVAALALAAPAAAQDDDGASGAQATPPPSTTLTPTPTPTPTPGADDEFEVGSPPEDATRAVRRVYRDFRRDGVITPCDHRLVVLRETRDTIPEEFEEEFPDFVESVKAAIQERKDSECVEEEEPTEEEADKDPDARNGSGGTPAPRPTATAGPSDAPLAPDPLPPDTGSSNAPLAPDPLPSVTPAPLPPDATPTVTPAPTPGPAATPAPPAVAPEPADPPAPVWGLAAGGGLLALAGLLAPLRGAVTGGGLDAFRHAWGEAGYRLRGAWLDFCDWLRVGR